MNSAWEEYFIKINIDKIYNDKNLIYPPKNLVYKAFSYFPPSETKVVFLGLDPYIREHQAHGLSFSVPEGVLVPPSLRNIYKEIQDDIGCTMNFLKGDLTRWAVEEKILLFNSALTVIKGQTGSHTHLWKDFTDHLLTKLSSDYPQIVFILLGNVAREKSVFITNKSNIIQAVHPSPLSAHRGFFGSKIFSKCNKLVGKKINWQIQ